MPKLKNIEKVAQAIGGTIDSFSDGSSSWVHLEDSRFTIDICFDEKGETFQGIQVAEKVYAVVDEKIIARIGEG